MLNDDDIGNIVSQMGATLRSEAASEKTIERYKQQVELILPKLASPNANDIKQFLGEALAQVKPSYRRYNYYVLKKVFKLLKVKWPEDLGPPRVPRSSVNRARFSPNEIASLVKHSTVLNPRDRFYSVMSVVYGLRREELTRLQKIHRKENKILVLVGKGGDPRWHIVPEEIRPILDGYDFENPEPITSVGMMSAQFHQICEMCGVETKKGDGWHKIRRTLIRSLRRNGYSRDDVHLFLRWKQPKSFLDIVDVYTGELEPEDLEMIDERIFQRHPFLHLWEGGDNHGVPRESLQAKAVGQEMGTRIRV